MKGLATLIKLHKRTLDELRRKMTALESQKSQLLQLSSSLKEELVQELKLAGKSPELGNFFGDFSKRIQMRREEIAGEVRSLDKKMAALNTQIAEAYSDLKKFEIVLANAKKRAEEEQRRQETIEMDEIAGQQFRRKMEDQ